MMHTTAVIQIRNLLIQAGQRTLLEIAHLQVHAGEHIAIIGANGAGKSTLLRVLGGMAQDVAQGSQGFVHVLGRGIGPDNTPALHSDAWRKLHAEIGRVMQGLHLVSRLTARENVILGALARPEVMPLWRSWVRLYPQTLHYEAEQALHDLGVLEYADTRVDQLSGGERQKVSLARLRLQRPCLILADEPTSALDPNATIDACRVLRTTAQNATLLAVVHNLEVLPLLASRVLGLVGGRVVFDLPVDAVNAQALQRLYTQDISASTTKTKQAWSSPTYVCS